MATAEVTETWLCPAQPTLPSLLFGGEQASSLFRCSVLLCLFQRVLGEVMGWIGTMGM